MEKKKWLTFSYTLPTEPSRHRVSIWRGLKKLGAVNIRQAIWILPYNETNYQNLQKICIEIEENSGEALLMKSEVLEDSQEESILSLFNHVRDEEYSELINECEKYLREIEKEIVKEKFIFAELEEEEVEYEKLASWFNKIISRDVFDAPLKSSAIEIQEKIKESFEKYSELVYKHNEK